MKCRDCGGDVDRVLVLAGASVSMPRCSSCGDASARRTDREDEERRRRLLLEKAGGGARWAGFDLTTYPTDMQGQAARQAAKKWLDDFYPIVEANRARLDAMLQGGDVDPHPQGFRNLLLYGGVGIGKSGLAWGIVRRLCEQGIPALFVVWRDLLDDMKAAIANDLPEPEAALRAKRIDVLALDDLGAERPTEYAIEELAVLVEARYQARLPTIVTSNLEPRMLAKRLGERDRLLGDRIVSRLLDGAQKLSMTGPDRRAEPTRWAA